MTISDIIARLASDARAFLRDDNPIPSAQGLCDLLSWGLVVRSYAVTGHMLLTLTDSGKVVRRELRGRDA